MGPHMKKPDTLTASPNVPWDLQTVEQLEAEAAWWQHCMDTAPGTASYFAAKDFLWGCRSWIERRRMEAAS